MRFLFIEVLDSLVSKNMNLKVMKCTTFINSLLCMTRNAIHISIRSGGYTVRENKHDMVNRFRVVAQEVPENIWVFEVCLRVRDCTPFLIKNIELLIFTQCITPSLM
ncbi:unnamed protein product [Debaryomyces tyrocola]|nr:unnamed protein product [Debaryomyces tyrocola]